MPSWSMVSQGLVGAVLQSLLQISLQQHQCCEEGQGREMISEKSVYPGMSSEEWWQQHRASQGCGVQHSPCEG